MGCGVLKKKEDPLARRWVLENQELEAQFLSLPSPFFFFFGHSHKLLRFMTNKQVNRCSEEDIHMYSDYRIALQITDLLYVHQVPECQESIVIKVHI
jgi:hypothetical protein